MTLRQREPRVRDERHLDYIRSLPCCICGDNTSTEAAHIRTSNLELDKDDFGWGRPSDKWATPLCGAHHREQHAMGDEMAFWKKYGLDPFLIAITLRAPRT
jgi:hypothetical protein